MVVRNTASGTVAGSIPRVTASSPAPRIGLLLGLLAIIAGVLGMHVWTGAHHPDSIGTQHVAEIGIGASHTQPIAGPALLAQDNGGTMTSLCANCGDTDMAAGMCILALFMTGIAGLLGLKPGLFISAARRRGPPHILPRTLPPLRPPSLVQLSISRI
ncbi:hypothetical protein E4J89_07310 [Arthrobacter sp. CAU 1506]|uniref:DUF6153 family protein n=1 Tax=Arthrobacter sp. CAU 1506 TaxID=2560052 RepID=UPI0010ACEBAB|nr:DUF6153 family protein [Arthrobacter sp. CAU 1506]TJY70485.1 hypothetical protein E4J89_07310 [Arthrobacter sp. CAU 1506]